MHARIKREQRYGTVYLIADIGDNGRNWLPIPLHHFALFLHRISFLISFPPSGTS